MAMGSAINDPLTLKNQQVMAKGTIALGQFRGKVGGQVMRVVDGKQVMQNYQPIVRNPETEPQKKQRAAIRTLGKLMRAFIVTLREGFGGIYPGSDFIKSNISRVTSVLRIDDPDSVEVNFSALKLTNGGADGLVVHAGGQVDWGEGQHLQVSAPFTVTLGDDVPADRVRMYMVAYCKEYNMSVLGSAVPTTASRVSVNCPATWDGLEVNAWLFASIAENGIDADAYDQSTLRLPKICTSAEYLGQGDLS